MKRKEMGNKRKGREEEDEEKERIYEELKRKSKKNKILLVGSHDGLSSLQESR